MNIPKYLFGKLARLLSMKNIYIIKSLNYRSEFQALRPNFDYVRYASLGLCYEEITKKNIPGNVAELGVYKGDFAKRLNQLFRDRKLYLFDTFSGFDDRDRSLEIGKGYSTADQNFSNTSIDLVRKQMLLPGNCIFKPGYFPESAADVIDTFCFVSIDADLFEPIYNGLQFFYPKLSEGGYVFIHDYNNQQYSGAKAAVHRFCSEHQVAYVPIPDSGGTVIISK